MEKDTMERAADPNFNLKAFLADAYLHPIFRSFEDDDDVEMGEVRVDKALSHAPSLVRCEASSPSPPLHAYRYEVDDPWYSSYAAA